MKNIESKKKEINNKKNSKNRDLDIKSEKKYKKIINKINIIYFIVLLFDLGLVMYFARNNIINYFTINGEEPVYIGNKHNLYFGRNYIVLVITFVVYLYYIYISKFYFKKKLKLLDIILPVIVLLLLNILVFYIFTIRVY